MGQIVTACALGVALLGASPVLADALEDARAAYIKAWEEAPLAIRKNVFVTEPAAGFGMYDERPNAVYASGEPLYIYLHPEGYGWNSADGGYQFGLLIGIRLQKADGEMVYEEADFLELATGSREMATEFYGNVTLNMPAFDPGGFLLELDLKDMWSDKTASISMPFEIK